MKLHIIRFICFIAFLFITDSVINGFEINDLGSYFLFAFLLTITYIAIIPTVKFFTLPANLLTFGIFNFVISCVYIYFFKYIIYGFEIKDGSIGPFITSNIQLEEVKLSLISVVIMSSLFLTIMNNIVSWCFDSKK
jgi:putative membrane protein